jgi:hypothetical protein
MNIFLWIIMIYILIFSVETYEDGKQRNLNQDGFCVLQNDEYLTTKNVPCQQLKHDVLHQLPDGYEFMDYIYMIKNVALSTFHRDVTSSKHVYKTTYPVYTLILYKNEGELLSVCPRSNQSYPFVWSSIVNVKGKKGTAFLFDCDLLHAGCTNYCKEREVIQYKICHRDDLNKLKHLQGIKKNKSGVCKITQSSIMLRKLTYFFEFPINYIFYPFMIQRKPSNTLMGKIQSFIPVEYYNN